MQQGTVFERSDMWYLRSWRTDFVNDADKKRRDTEMLLPKDDQHGNERDVRIRSARQISDILNPINLRTHQPASSMAFADFMGGAVSVLSLSQGQDSTRKTMTEDRGGAVYQPNFLSAAEADVLLAALAKLPWSRGTQTRGFHIGDPVPRDEVWMGPYPYLFSRRVLDPVSWTSEIEALRDRIEAAGYGSEYNSVLLNRYRDGDDGVGWHADKEKEMDPQHPIASVSLGACRKFKVRANDTREIQTFLLSAGSLLIMLAGFQQSHEHTVPPMKASIGERINLTFRRMLPRGK